MASIGVGAGKGDSVYPSYGQVLETLPVLVTTGVGGETFGSPVSELDFPSTLGAPDPWDPEAFPGQVRGLEVSLGLGQALTCLPTSDSICQERGLWNCTAQRCAPPRAFCPRGLVCVPGASLLTCDSPSVNGSCPPGSMGRLCLSPRSRAAGKSWRGLP